jgi:hypothetical protein
MLSAIKGIEPRDQRRGDACRPDCGWPRGKHDVHTPARPCSKTFPRRIARNGLSISSPEHLRCNWRDSNGTGAAPNRRSHCNMFQWPGGLDRVFVGLLQAAQPLPPRFTWDQNSSPDPRERRIVPALVDVVKRARGCVNLLFVPATGKRLVLVDEVSCCHQPHFILKRMYLRNTQKQALLSSRKRSSGTAEK